MKKKYYISWLLAGFLTTIFMAHLSAMAADRVVVIPLLSCSDRPKTVTSKTGKVWVDRNLGADRVAESKGDTYAFGWLYQWGRPADGHEIPQSLKTNIGDLSSSDVPGHSKFILVDATPNDWRSSQNDQLWLGEAAPNNPCPSGFRLPTIEEWQNEVLTWSGANADGAYGSVLKLPLSGYRNYKSGTITGVDDHAYYWTSSVEGTNAVSMKINSTTAIESFDPRGYGQSVRCIKDN